MSFCVNDLDCPFLQSCCGGICEDYCDWNPGVGFYVGISVGIVIFALMIRLCFYGCAYSRRNNVTYVSVPSTQVTTTRTVIGVTHQERVVPQNNYYQRPPDAPPVYQPRANEGSRLLAGEAPPKYTQ